MDYVGQHSAWYPFLEIRTLPQSPYAVFSTQLVTVYRVFNSQMYEINQTQFNYMYEYTSLTI